MSDGMHHLQLHVNDLDLATPMTKMAIATGTQDEKNKQPTLSQWLQVSKIPVILKVVTILALVYLGSLLVWQSPTTTTTTTPTKTSTTKPKAPPLLLPNLIQFPGPNRTAPLQATVHNVSFVHISKCAGASWINELKPWVLALYPPVGQGPEQSISFQRLTYPRDYTFTSVKSPRHHVWSLFTECKYDAWGIGTTQNTGFPRSGNTTKADLIDFEQWLDAFLVMAKNNTTEEINRQRRNGFGYCYHPANYQTRAFVVHHSNPHFVEDPPSPYIDAFEPSVLEAIRTYWQLEWVGLAELYVESNCLLYYRFEQGALHQGPPTDHNQRIHWDKAVNRTQSYVTQNCQCSNPRNTEAMLHETHHELGHRASMRHGIAPRILAKMDVLTKSDSVLYKHALIQLLKELLWLEDQLGRRVLCDEKLEYLDYELHYLTTMH